MSSGSNTLRSRPRINAMSIAGFKSLMSGVTIQLANLTILAGANSSGKSSAMQPMLLLKQTLEAPFDPGAILLNGPLIQFNRATNFLSKDRNDEVTRQLTVAFADSSDASLELLFRPRALRGVELVSMSFRDSANVPIQTLTPHMTSEEVSRLVQGDLKFGAVPGMPSPKMRWEARRERFFIKLQGSPWPTPDDRGVFISYGMGPDIERQVEQFLRRMIHIRGVRGNPSRTYPVSAMGGDLPGAFENYVASIIHDWRYNERDKIERLEELLTVMGLTTRISSRFVDDANIELRVGRTASTVRPRFVNIADVGFGVSQALPILVALVRAQPESTIYVEQPELHLHPRALVELTKAMCMAAKAGIRVVAETHSPLFIRVVQTLLAGGHFKPSDVALHWFSRDPASGDTSVRLASLDSKGSFADWPSDLDEISLQAESEYLSAALGRQK